MKIGIIARDLSRKQGGGAYNFIRQSCELLPKIDKDNEYFAFVQGEVEMDDDIEKVFIPKVPKLFWDHVLVPLYAYTKGIDLIFSPKNTKPFFWFGKTVVSILDLAYFDLPKAYRRLESAYMRLMIRHAIMKSTIVVGISDYTVKRIKGVFKHIDDTKIQRVYLSHDSEFRFENVVSEEEICEKYSITNPYVLFVGGIQPRKNLETLARSMEQLWKKGVNLDLIVVGRKSVKHEEVLGKIREGTYKKIKFTGYIDREDLLSLYRYALVYAYPSRYEGFGIPVLEAMSMGCPVIASNVTSLPEVIGDAGRTLAPDDYRGFADSIQNLLQNKVLRRDYVKKGFARANEFSWEKCMQEYLKLFKRLDY